MIFPPRVGCVSTAQRNHWSRQTNTPKPNTARGSFEVKHCFHPLHGQTLELVAIRNNWDVDQVYYHDQAGRLRTIPVTWTSLISADPVVVFGGGRSPFKLVDLLELARLVEALQEQQQAQTPQAEPGVDKFDGGQNV